MFGIGAQELAIICVVALLIFGPKRLPELARTLGKGMAEFRRASSDLRASLEFDPPATPRPAPTVPRPVSPPPSDPREQREPEGLPAQSIAPEPPPDVDTRVAASPPSEDAAAAAPEPGAGRDSGSA